MIEWGVGDVGYFVGGGGEVYIVDGFEEVGESGFCGGFDDRGVGGV